MAELPKIKKNLKGEIKGTIKGTRGGSRNDLSNPNWRLQAKKKVNDVNVQVYRGDLNFHPRPLTYSLF